MLNESIQALVDYAERTGLIESADRVWAVNRLLEVLHADTYTPPKQAASGSLHVLLNTRRALSLCGSMRAGKLLFFILLYFTPFGKLFFIIIIIQEIVRPIVLVVTDHSL